MDIVQTKKVDVCFLSETWFNKAKNSTTEQIKSYSFRIFHSNVLGRGRGTALLLKNGLTYKKVQFCSHNSSFDAVIVYLSSHTVLVSLYWYVRFGSAFDIFIVHILTL